MLLEIFLTSHIDFLSFLDNVEIIVNKIRGKKNRGHRTPRLKSRQSYSNGLLPYYLSFYYLARALVYDVACEFACAVRMRRNNWRERP